MKTFIMLTLNRHHNYVGGGKAHPFVYVDVDQVESIENVQTWFSGYTRLVTRSGTEHRLAQSAEVVQRQIEEFREQQRKAERPCPQQDNTDPSKPASPV